MLEGLGFLAGFPVPDLHQPIAAATDHRLAIHGERDARHRVPVALQHREFLARGDIPHADCLVVGGAGELRSVACEGDGNYRVRVSGELRDALAGCWFIEVNRLVGTRDGDERTIGGIRHRQRLVGDLYRIGFRVELRRFGEAGGLRLWRGGGGFLLAACRMFAAQRRQSTREQAER